GAEIHLTPAIEGMSGAVFAAEELVREHPGYVMPQQFQNPANPAVHRRTTALEILGAVGGRLDAFVAGVGTGGTLTGVGEVLKEKMPGILVVAVEPAKSPVLAGGKPRPHGIQGIGASFVPGVLNRAIIDRVEVRAKDVGAMLDELEAAHAGLRGLVRGDSGELHRHVSIYVNSEAIEGLGTPLKDGDEVAIIPALAGGAC